MSQIIIQKCNCGYIYEEAQKVAEKIIPPATIPLILKRKILKGDEQFKNLDMLSDYDYDVYLEKGHKEISRLIICPKCGAVLLSSIAMIRKYIADDTQYFSDDENEL